MRNQKKGDEKTFDYHPKKNLFNPKNIYSFLQIQLKIKTPYNNNSTDNNYSVN